jgi:hypothetical protein
MPQPKYLVTAGGKPIGHWTPSRLDAGMAVAGGRFSPGAGYVDVRLQGIVTAADVSQIQEDAE